MTVTKSSCRIVFNPSGTNPATMEIPELNQILLINDAI
jgi:hypothetical protein